jgi:hypothetical protein
MLENQLERVGFFLPILEFNQVDLILHAHPFAGMG